MNLEEIAEKYKTDKRFLEHNYIPYYEKYFSNIRENKLKILEIGIYRPNPNSGREVAASLKTWYDYFPNAEIYGVDLTDFSDVENDRIKTIICNQGIRENSNEYPGLETIIENFGNEFDIIIDDGGHTMQQQQVTLGYMFKYLKPGGIFVIEDLHTSVMGLNAYNPTNSKITTLSLLNDLVTTKKVTSDFMTEEEMVYLNNHIKTCEIFKANISEISFIVKND